MSQTTTALEQETTAATDAIARSSVRHGLPPGPRWPMPVQTLLAIFFTDRFTRYCRDHFDSLVSLHVAGMGKFVSTWDPELVKALFTGKPEDLWAGEANARFVRAPAGPNSVLVLDGERHLHMRRLLLAPFHGDAVKAYQKIIAELTAAEIERWPVNEELAAHPRMQALTLEVILRAVIGVSDRERLVRLRTLLARAPHAHPIVFLAESAYPHLASGALGSRLPWIAARRKADRLLYEEIAAHRTDPDGREDVLSLLLAARTEDGRALTDEELRDQLFTLLGAGHETTAAALAWCFERLVRHPRYLKRLRDEIAVGEGDEYLDAVVNETLRTRPVLDQVVRTLAAPMELGGYILPAGTIVSASILGVQLSDAFEDPDEFRPERFLGRSAPAYALIPFGGGVRRCVGASFAVMEMKTILRTVLERVELRATNKKAERAVRWKRFTVTPSEGGRVVVGRERVRR